MPVLPSPDENFIRGLSDFWSRFFQDTSSIEALYEATQVQLGQAYLELLQDVLGTSLDHAPLFSRKYFHLVTIREDQLAFVEGPSLDDDRYVLRGPEVFADAPALTNRVIVPTNVLDRRAHYDLVDGQLAFYRDPFHYDAPGEAVPGFPVRQVTTRTSADLAHLTGGDWRQDVGARAGDELLVILQGGTRVRVGVVATQGRYLVLAQAPESLRVDLHDRLAARVWSWVVLRRPHDAHQFQVELPSEPVATTALRVHAVLGSDSVRVLRDGVAAVNATHHHTNVLAIDNAAPSWVGRLLALTDPTQPANDGLYTVTAVNATLVSLSAPLLATGAVTATIGDDVEAWTGQYVQLLGTEAPNRLTAKVVAKTGTCELQLDATTLVVSTTPFEAFRMSFTDNTPSTPAWFLGHTVLVEGSVEVLGTRFAARTVGGVTYPAGGPLVEGVDYAVNYDSGVLTVLGPWDPRARPRATYEWRLIVGAATYLYRGAWSNLVAYDANDIVDHDGRRWVAATTPVIGTFVAAEWVELVAPFRFGTSFDFREIALWAPDVLLDADRLYTNFGYLLSYRRPSSEQYRAFLKGVSQLFLLGPTPRRFESALNVMANLPVVRTDGEVLASYDDGYEVLGAAGLVAVSGDAKLGARGELVDGRYGNDGVLTTGTNAFTVNDPRYLGAWSAVLTYARGDVVLHLGRRWVAVVDAPAVGTFVPEGEWTEQVPFFFPSDVGAVIETRTSGGTFAVYTVTAVDATGVTATVSPPVPASETGVSYEYAHVVVRRRFSVNTALVTYAFTEDDVGAVLEVATAREARNLGRFRIASVEGPGTVYLDGDAPFVDEVDLRFRVSRQKQQVVTTDRARYVLPLGVAVREDVADPASVGALAFRSFECLADAIRVVDYVTDPTWWHHITIPQEVLQMAAESAARRQVSPVFVEHVFNALDQAVFDDLGMMASADDEGRPGIARDGAATWTGGGYVTLSLPANTPTARPSDAGRYLHVPAGPFRGDYEIREVSTDGLTLRLDRFPPPEAAGLVAPQAVAAVQLPPLLYRRTVGFVMMDRLLKYHAMRVEVRDPDVLSTEFIADAVALLRQARPAHTFVYFEPVTSFVDTVSLRETFAVDFGPLFADPFAVINNALTFSTRVLFNEYFSYASRNETIAHPGGALGPLAVAATFPYVEDRQFMLQFRFTQGTTGGRPLREGTDYSVDYDAGTVTVTASVDAGTVELDSVHVGLRVVSPLPSPWWSGVNASTAGAVWYGETPVCFNGPDPTTRLNPGMDPAVDQGLIDRALQIVVA